MRHLVMDYITRHPVMLGLVCLASLVWGINARDITVFCQGLPIVHILILWFCVFIIDSSEGTWEVLRVLPLSSRQVVRTYWFIWVFVGPVVAYGGYFPGTLVGYLFGSHRVFDGRMLVFGLEALIYMGAMSWSTVAVVGDPTRGKWSKGLLGLIFGFAWLGSFFIPNEWLMVVCANSPSSILPVILICGVVSYLVSPPVPISDPSPSRSEERDSSEKSVEAPIVFPSLRAILFRSLMNRLLLATMLMGILCALFIGLDDLFADSRNSVSGDNTDRVSSPIIKVAVIQLFVSLFRDGMGIKDYLRGLRVLPLRTSLLALVMTLYPLDMWVGLGLGSTIVCVVWGKWTLLPDFLPVVIVIGSVSSLFTAMITGFDRNWDIDPKAVCLLGIDLVVIAITTGVFFAGQLGLLGPNVWMNSLLVATLSLGFACMINRTSLRSSSSIYLPPVLFGRLAPQAVKR